MQSTRVDEGITIKDILETEDMFEEDPDKIVDMVNLTVRMQIRRNYCFNFQEKLLQLLIFYHYIYVYACICI